MPTDDEKMIELLKIYRRTEAENARLRGALGAIASFSENIRLSMSGEHAYDLYRISVAARAACGSESYEEEDAPPFSETEEFRELAELQRQIIEDDEGAGDR